MLTGVFLLTAWTYWATGSWEFNVRLRTLFLIRYGAKMVRSNQFHNLPEDAQSLGIPAVIVDSKGQIIALVHRGCLLEAYPLQVTNQNPILAADVNRADDWALIVGLLLRKLRWLFLALTALLVCVVTAKWLRHRRQA
jgi:hypothetical protein